MPHGPDAAHGPGAQPPGHDFSPPTSPSPSQPLPAAQPARGHPSGQQLEDDVPAEYLTEPEAAAGARPHRSAARARQPQAPMSLRRRVTLLAASTVGVAVALMAVAAYFVVSGALYQNVNTRLERQASQLVNSEAGNQLGRQPQAYVTALRAFNPDLDAQIVLPSGLRVGAGADFSLGDPELAVVQKDTTRSIRTANNKQILAVAVPDGSTLILAQDLGPTREVLGRLALVLSVVGGLGIVLAAAAGTAVGRTGLAPVGRLTRAVERVTRTDDLRPIPVAGDDELARLTYSFNQMLLALKESRERQARLVADAGHELKTPMTSLRTNVELLIASSRPNAPAIPEKDRRDLERDCIAQIEELSTLVGDLVDLAREDAGASTIELVNLSDVVDRVLERVRRRRLDVSFDVQQIDWYLYGDDAGFERAIMNLFDNAAKWSPEGGVVTLRMEADGRLLTLEVSDQGPGIPEADRELVFERFYRAIETRTMPGSGLGLAIVRQVVVKHGGDIEALEAPGGGALMRMTLPGSAEPPPDDGT